MDLKVMSQNLDQFLRLSTFPLALKMLKEGEPLPEKVRLPQKDLGKRIAICQAVSMARRYGWALALGGEELACPIGAVAMGFVPPIDYYQEGTLCEGLYTQDKAAGARSEEAVDKFPLGYYQKILMAPVSRAAFAPDLFLIYGNSAQVLRLVQATLYHQGGKLTSSFRGRADCSEIIVSTLFADEPQVILPCTGDRIFGQTQDHEMAFSFPASWAPRLMEGLEATHRAGTRYPIPVYLQYEAVFPPTYQELEKRLKG